MARFIFAVGAGMTLLALVEAASIDTVDTRPRDDEPQDERRDVIRGSASGLGGQGRGYECGALDLCR